MNKTFQVILLIVFGVFVVIAVIVFAVGGGGGGEEEISGEVSIWGIFPEEEMGALFREFVLENEGLQVNYVQKPEASFENELVDALASSRGPDLVFLPHTLLVAQKDRLLPIPYEAISERQFRDSFISAGEIFLGPAGIYAIPFAVDPLIMYWNKTIFASFGLSIPPRFWNEFLTLAPTLSIKSQSGGFSQSAVALGESRNVLYQKEILSALIGQAGNEIIKQGEGGLEAVLGDGTEASSALRFYTEFSNPNKAAYSWSSAEPVSRDAFAGGELAVYFGLGSDDSVLKERNPHLDFDVAVLPQIKGGNSRNTYGNVYGFAILSSSPNQQAAYVVATRFAFGRWPEAAFPFFNMAPARRDILSSGTEGAVAPVLYQSAIMTKVWPDPASARTKEIFRQMVDLVTINRLGPDEAVSRAQALLGSLIREVEEK